MGFIGLRRRFPSCLTQAQIDLFVAVKSRNDKRIGELINRYDEIIRHEFPKWRRCPEPIMNDKYWSDFYANGLIGVADYYRRCGIGWFIEFLQGNADNNPLIGWSDSLTAIQTALIDGRFDFVISKATQAIADMDSMSGSGVDSLKPKFLGILGAAYFKKGDKSNALRFTQLALQSCKESKDQEGERIYKANLIQIKANT